MSEATDLTWANLLSSEQARVTVTALQQHCVMFDECQGRDLHKNREKHVLLDTAPLRAMQGSGTEAGPRWQHRQLSRQLAH